MIASRPQDGLAIWDTPYAKRRYYTGTPSKDKNQNASLQWVKKGVNTYKKELGSSSAERLFEGNEQKVSVYDDVLTAVIDLAEQTELYSKIVIGPMPPKNGISIAWGSGNLNTFLDKKPPSPCRRF